MIDGYIYFYNHERIQLKPRTAYRFRFVSPVEVYPTWVSFCACLLFLGRFRTSECRLFYHHLLFSFPSGWMALYCKKFT